VLAVALCLLRWQLPERPLNYTGAQALFDSFFALALLGFILLVAGGLGLKVQRRLGTTTYSTALEQVVFGGAIGLGILAYGVLILGLVGFLTPTAILIWLILAGMIAWPEWIESIEQIQARLTSRSFSWSKILAYIKYLFLIGCIFMVLAILQALAPPWDYDALLYHLQAPKLFLQAGRIKLLPDVPQANGPATVEMLYTLGLAFGTDAFAKLINLTYATILVLASAAFGHRYLGKNRGWIAAAVLLGIPILLVWANLANADMGWALYEFLAIYALIRFCESGRKSWLTIAGSQMGWALGSKYLALGGLGTLGLWLLWRTFRHEWRASLYALMRFGLIAGLLGLPWYLKNGILYGNPFYPFLLGGPAWNTDRLAMLMRFLSSFGTGKTFVDYLLLPIRLYTHHSLYGTYMTRIEFPSLLFPVVLLYPLLRRDRVWDTMAAITGLRFVVWAFGSQQTRFLLPLFPSLSLITTFVLLRVGELLRTPVVRRILGVGLLGGLVVTSLVYQVILFGSISPLAVILGIESKDTFLQRTVYDYPALKYAQDQLPAEARIMMMWDGQGYYCDQRCLPDAEQAQWTLMVNAIYEPLSLASALKERGVTHMLLSMEGLNFFLQHDPMGQHLAAAELYLHQFRQACTKEIYRDQYMILDEITCH